MHRCFFTSLPPNLGLSKQYRHCPQSSAKQPGHSRQPILLLLVTVTAPSSPNCCFRLDDEPEGVALITIPLVDGLVLEAVCGDSNESADLSSCLIDCLLDVLLIISLLGCLLILIWTLAGTGFAALALVRIAFLSPAPGDFWNIFGCFLGSIIYFWRHACNRQDLQRPPGTSIFSEQAPIKRIINYIWVIRNEN